MNLASTVERVSETLSHHGLPREHEVILLGSRVKHRYGASLGKTVPVRLALRGEGRNVGATPNVTSVTSDKEKSSSQRGGAWAEAGAPGPRLWVRSGRGHVGTAPLAWR